MITEALSFTVATHRANLEKLLGDSDEAKIVPEESETKEIKDVEIMESNKTGSE